MSLRKRSLSARARARGYRPRRYARTRYGRRSTYRVASRAAQRRVAANLRTGGYLGIETKYFDTSFEGAIVGSKDWGPGHLCTIPTYGVLNGLAVGSSQEQRDGRQITLRSVTVSGVVYIPVTAGTTAANCDPRLVHIALVLDKQANGAAMDPAQVYSNQRSDDGGTLRKSACAFPLRNMQYIQRYAVLAKKTMVLQPIVVHNGTGHDLLAAEAPFQFNVKLGSIIQDFIGDAAGVASCSNNTLNVIMNCEGSGGDTSITFNARVRFRG